MSLGGLFPQAPRTWTSVPLAALAVLAALAALTLGAALPLGPWLVLGAAAAIAAVVLAVGLNVHTSLTPWWPIGVVAVLQPLNGLRPIPGASVGDIGLVVLGILCLPLLGAISMPPRVLVPFIGTLLLTAGGLLGTIATQDWGSAVQLAKFLFGAPGVILLLSMLNPTPKLAAGLGVMYGVGATISAIAGAAGHTDPYFQRALGFGAHQLHLALSTLFATVVMVGWFASTKNKWARAAAAIMGAICLYGMLLTGARSALLGLTAALVFFALVGRAKGVAALVGAGVAAAVVLAVLMPFMPQGSTLYRMFGGGELESHVSASDSLHVLAARQALGEIGTHPFTGLGFGQGLDAHNMLLEAANVGGVLGVVGLCLIWGTFWALLLQMLVRGIHRQDALRASLLVAVVGYFVLGQLENILWDRHLWFFMTLALFAVPDPKPLEEAPVEHATST